MRPKFSEPGSVETNNLSKQDILNQRQYDHNLEQKVEESNGPSAETQREALDMGRHTDLTQSSEIKADDTTTLYRGLDVQQPLDSSKQLLDDMCLPQRAPDTHATKAFSSVPMGDNALVEKYSVSTIPEQSLTEKAYAAAAGVAAGVASFFTSQKSYDEESVACSYLDNTSVKSQDHLLDTGQALPIHEQPQKDSQNITQVEAYPQEESQQTVHEQVQPHEKSLEEYKIETEPVVQQQQPVPQNGVHLDPFDEVKKRATPPILQNETHYETPSAPQVTLNTAPTTVADILGVQAGTTDNVLLPRPQIIEEESFSSTRVLTSGIVPEAPAPTKRKNSLQNIKCKTAATSSAIVSAFRRLSLKDNKITKRRHLSDAELFKNQMIEQQMSAHPASVVWERRRSDPTALDEVDPRSKADRRGSIQKLFGKITKNNTTTELFGK